MSTEELIRGLWSLSDSEDSDKDHIIIEAVDRIRHSEEKYNTIYKRGYRAGYKSAAIKTVGVLVGFQRQLLNRENVFLGLKQVKEITDLFAERFKLNEKDLSKAESLSCEKTLKLKEIDNV